MAVCLCERVLCEGVIGIKSVRDRSEVDLASSEDREEKFQQRIDDREF